MMQKIYTLNLAEESHKTISRLVSSNENFELSNLNDFDETLALGRGLTLKYLILDSATSPSDILNMKEKVGASLMGTHVLWMSGNDLDSIKNADIFSTISSLSNELTVIQKASAFFDYLNQATDPPLCKERSYVPLELFYLENISQSPCDIFLKISDRKFVKIIRKNDDFKITEIIEKYASKNIKEFYVTLENTKAFKESFLKDLFEQDKTGNVTDHQLKVTGAVLSIAADFGLSEMAIEGINTTFAEIDKEFNSVSKFKGLLEKLQQNQGTVLSNHSYLTAVFITLIGQKTPWFNREIKKNLFLAAILHDLDLHGTGLEAYEFKTVKEINTLPLKERELVKNHPTTLSAKLSKIDSIPSDVINLISKQHEGAGSESYPMGLHSPQLAPPNCLFNVAHQLSIEVSKIAFNMNKVSTAIEKVREHYVSNSMKSFIDLFEGQISKE